MQFIAEFLHGVHPQKRLKLPLEFRLIRLKEPNLSSCHKISPPEYPAPIP